MHSTTTKPSSKMLTSGVNSLIDQTVKQASFETYNFLGESGIKVSKICFGTMTFGTIDKTFGDRPGQLDDVDAHRLLDRYVELGGNFIDTGAFYPFVGSTAGESETIIGNWLTRRKDRKKLVILTNVGLPTDFRNPNAIGLNRVNLINSLEDSLRRLKTPYIDVFCISGWDEATNVGDIMRTLNDFVRSGRVRHVGCCDLKGYQLQMCLDYAKKFNLEKFVTISCEYNLLSRGADLEIADICRTKHVGMLAYSPLKGGYLTNKIKPGMTKLPEHTRISAATRDYRNLAALAVPYDEIKDNELYNRIMTTCNEIAKKQNKTIAQVALRYLLHKDFICSVIIGCKTLSQLEENMGCLTFSLTQEEVDELDRVSLPPLPSPYNVDSFFKMTRSRLQLHSNLFTSNLTFQKAVSLPVHAVVQPTLVSVPTDIMVGFKSMDISAPYGYRYNVSPSRRSPSPSSYRGGKRSKSPTKRSVSPSSKQMTETSGRKTPPTLGSVSKVRDGRMSPTERQRMNKSGNKTYDETSPYYKTESKVEHMQQQQPKGEKMSSKNVEQQKSSLLGTTLGNIAHSIASPLSGGGLSGLNTSFSGTESKRTKE